MRAHATEKQGIAIEQQMVGRDGGSGVGTGLRHVVSGFARGDVLEDDFQLRKIFAQRHQVFIYEHRLAVEQIDIRIGDFTVHQQRHACALHGLERGARMAQIGDACAAVGGGPCGVELDGNHTGFVRPDDFICRGLVCKVQGHQRLKVTADGQCCEYAFAVSQGLCGGGDRRLEVGHDDGAGKLRGSVRDNSGECVAVAQMNVPVVGVGESQRMCHIQEDK